MDVSQIAEPDVVVRSDGTVTVHAAVNIPHNSSTATAQAADVGTMDTPRRCTADMATELRRLRRYEVSS